MPTILLLDTSLSMTRPVPTTDNTEEYQRRHLAIHGINAFLDHLTANAKLEFVSLVAFSAHTEQLVPFTRDYESIKAAMTAADDHNKTCIETALRSLSPLAMEEWGINAACQAILVTDGSTGTGETSLSRAIQAYHQSRMDAQENKFPLPFEFPCKLIIMCVAPPGEGTSQAALQMYQELIDINGRGGELFCPEGALTLKSTQLMFVTMAECYFRPYFGILKCGNLESRVQLLPSPDIYDRAHDFEHVHKTVSDVLQVVGFLHIGDIASPPYISRHLCLPVPASSQDGDAKTGKVKGESGKEEEEEVGDGKTAAFTVLLHGSLKVESMVAVVLLAEDWFGIMYSWADSKKKSNLMLSVFTPGVDVIPWLGSLSNLAPVTDFSESPYGDDNNKTPFPVKPPDRRSYAQNCVVWIKPAGLQTDIQKILRNARKLPEKQQNFYKELNRLRRAVLSYGFHELLDAVAQLLERECTLLPGNAHPDAALQLTHAANALRADTVWDIGHNIMPLRTNFSGE